jgi:hypothetical protein
MIEKSMAVTNPSMVTFGTMYAARSTKAALTTSEKRPSVTIVRGNVRKETIGFIKTLIIPSTTARTTMLSGVIVTPGK